MCLQCLKLYVRKVTRSQNYKMTNLPLDHSDIAVHVRVNNIGWYTKWNVCLNDGYVLGIA